MYRNAVIPSIAIRDLLIGSESKDEYSSNLLPKKSRPKEPVPVDDLTVLHKLINEGYRVRDVDVRGNTTINLFHPVVQELYRRKESNEVSDDKIAMVIEGGGMRG